MRGKDLFEYAVLRVVPRVEREEFLNVGVILYCRDQKFLDVKCLLNRDKLLAMYGGFDVDDCQEFLDAFVNICRGKEARSPISAYEPAERFRWLTANRSSVLQVSPVHPGLCDDASETLERLFDHLVV